MWSGVCFWVRYWFWVWLYQFRMTVPLLYSLRDFSVVLLLSIVIHYVIVPFCRDVIKINRTLLLKQAMMHTCTVALHNCKLLQRGY